MAFAFNSPKEEANEKKFPKKFGKDSPKEELAETAMDKKKKASMQAVNNVLTKYKKMA